MECKRGERSPLGDSLRAHYEGGLLLCFIRYAMTCNLNPMKRGPSLWWLGVAALVFLFGAGGGIALLVWQIVGLGGGDTFLVPSTQVLQVDAPGTYILWHDYQVTFEGKVYNKEPALPDQTILRLTHEGEEMPMASVWGSTVTSGQHAKTDVGRYEIDEPGEYTLHVTGFDEARVFSFGQSRLKDILSAVVGCVLLSLLGWLGGPAIMAVVLILRSQRPKEC